MTENERIEIVQEVLAALKVNSKTISQLAPVSAAGNADYLELNGGRRVKFADMAEQIRALNDDALERLNADVSTLKYFVDTLLLDEIGLEGWGRDELMAVMLAMKPMAYRVMAEHGGASRSIGLLVMHSDGYGCQLTQVLVTNSVIDASGEMGIGHNDRRTYVYRRNLGDASSKFTAEPRPAWSAWERIDGCVEAWASGQVYCKGALLTHGGVLWRAEANAAQSEPASDNADYLALSADAKAMVDAEAQARQEADALKLDKSAVAQDVGSSSTLVMSQKAVTENFPNATDSKGDDFALEDENGNVIFNICDGFPETKNFKGRDISEQLKTTALDLAREIAEREMTTAEVIARPSFRLSEHSGDLAIADGNNNVLAVYHDGWQETAKPSPYTEEGSEDLAIKDGDNVLVLFKDGHIQTANFNSRDAIGDIAELQNKEASHKAIFGSQLECLDTNAYGNDGAQSLQIVHISDSHADTRAVEIAVELSKYDTVDLVLHTGDFCNYTNPEQIKVYANFVASSEKPFLFVFGNHDAGNSKSVSECCTHVEGYDSFIKPMVDKGTILPTNGKNYYYKDFVNRRIRLIALYEFDAPLDLEDGSSTEYRISRHLRLIRKEQSDWFVSVLNSAPEGYGIIVATHQGFSRFSIGDSSKLFQTGLRSGGAEVQDAMDTDLIAEVVHHFVSREAGTMRVKCRKYNDSNDATYLNAASAGDESYYYDLDYDFTNVPSSTKFMCFLNGHGHRDEILHHSSYAELWGIAVTCMGAKNKNSSTDIVVSSNPSSIAYNCITVEGFDVQNGRIRLNKLGARHTVDGRIRDYEIINV